MDEKTILLPEIAPPAGEEKGDVDDLIFQGEGWLISDR